MRKGLLIAAAVFLLAGCKKTATVSAPAAEPAKAKRYKVIQEGKLAGLDLELIYDQLSTAAFKTRDGRTVVYHGTFYYEEMEEWK